MIVHAPTPRVQRRSDTPNLKTLRHKSQALALIRAIHRDPMFAHPWPYAHSLTLGVKHRWVADPQQIEAGLTLAGGEQLVAVPGKHAVDECQNSRVAVDVVDGHDAASNLIAVRDNRPENDWVDPEHGWDWWTIEESRGIRPEVLR